MKKSGGWRVLVLLGLCCFVLSGCQIRTRAVKELASRLMSEMENETSGEEENGITEETESQTSEKAETDTSMETDGEENSTDKTKESPEGESSREQEGMEGEDAAVEPEAVRVLSDLGMDGRLLDEDFFMAGDLGKKLYFSVIPGEDGDVFISNRMGIYFMKISRENSGGNGSGAGQRVVSAPAEIFTAKGQNTYQVSLHMQEYENGNEVRSWIEPVEIIFGTGRDGSLQIVVTALQGESEAAGKYCPESAMGEIPDLASRYVSQVELACMPSENLRILRNSLYAAHGRKFTDPVLSGYFQRQSWYRGWVEPEDFSEQVFSDVEKANLARIRELEQMSWDERNPGEHQGPEGMEPAPYMEYLDRNRETGLQAELARAEDRGAYWSVPGVLSLPVTMTRSQWEAVQRGDTAALCVNELTGEKRILEYYPGKGYLFYEEGTVPDLEYQAWDIRISFNYGTGYYELQQASDDTIMKPVYEGELWFAEGAVQGSHVGIEWASQIQEEIPFGTEKTGEIFGNYLVHNGKGLFEAVYYLGD